MVCSTRFTCSTLFLHYNFCGVGASTTNYDDGLVTGHPPGGVAILWHKRIDHKIKSFDTKCDWCTAIEFNIGTNAVVIINVYLPYQCPANEESYIQKLGYIHAILEELNTSCYVVLGDWNANIGDVDNSLFAPHLLDFCHDHGYYLSTQSLLPHNSYTHVSEAWGTVSWLDHVVSSADFHDSIDNITIDYDSTDVNHIPVMVTTSLSNMPAVNLVNNECTSSRLKWGELSVKQRSNYSAASHELLSKINIPNAIHCSDINCTDAEHINAITNMYGEIIGCLRHASDSIFNPNNNSDRNSACINKPGWADYVADLYDDSKTIGKLWCNAGKPRQGQIYNMYRNAKSRCKYAIRFIKRHENTLRRESLAKKLVGREPKEFWNKIKQMNSSRIPLPSCIDGISGVENIAEMWREHYSSLFNSVQLVNGVRYDYDLRSEYNDVLVTSQEVEKAIRELDCNKSCGVDCIYTEHLLYSSNLLYKLLGLCMTSFMVHGFLPDDMMAVALVPVIKSKSGHIMSKDNYRPIALASIVSKVIEKILLNRMYEFLSTCHNQFGFKKKHGTDQCIYVLKEIIDAYRVLNGSVFTCFLDASKAFDRVSHSILFEKLNIRGVPRYIIRLLMYWYANQTMCVRWGGVYSNYFGVSNGVRQGGILSPYLFNIYVDDLSINLNACRSGCYLDGLCINHLMYADDLVILSPSTAGLSKLLLICEVYGISHIILYNYKKSATMSFRSRHMHGAQLPQFTLNGEILKDVNVIQYLSHFVCNDLSDDTDIRRQCRSLSIQGNILLRNFHMCSLDVKLALFRSYCTPMYTAQLWWNHKKCSLNRLCITYHNVLKMSAGLSKFESTSLLCTLSNMPCCKAVIRNLVFRFMCRLYSSDNILVKAVRSSSVIYTSRIRQYWRKLIYVHV